MRLELTGMFLPLPQMMFLLLQQRVGFIHSFMHLELHLTSLDNVTITIDLLLVLHGSHCLCGGS